MAGIVATGLPEQRHRHPVVDPRPNGPPAGGAKSSTLRPGSARRII